MNRTAREYILSADQPILRRPRRRRKADRSEARMEAFWRNFDLERLTRGWQQSLRPQAASAEAA